MDEVVKNISNERLDYYREHINECPIDILRVLYAEKSESEAYLYDAYQDAGKKMFEYAEENERLKDLYVRTAKHLEEIGKPEMAEYFLAQIQAIPTWNVGEM